MADVQPLDKGFLEAGACDIASTFYRIWRRENGLLVNDLVNLSPHLLINSWTIPDNNPPEIMFAGNESLVTKIHGREFLRNGSEETQVPNQGLRALARDGYVQAHHGEPVYDLVSCEIGTWERLILPFQNGQGLKSLVTLCIPVGSIQIVDRSNQEHRHGDYTPTSYQAGTEMAPSATG